MAAEAIAKAIGTPPWMTPNTETQAKIETRGVK